MQDNTNTPINPESNDSTSPLGNTSNTPNPSTESSDWTSTGSTSNTSTPPSYDAPKPHAAPSGPYGSTPSGYDAPPPYAAPAPYPAPGGYGQSSPYGNPPEGYNKPADSYGQPQQPSQYSPYGQPSPHPQYGQANQFAGSNIFAGLSSPDQAVKDEEISKWLGIGGVVSWWAAWFLGGFPFLFTIIAGIIGLVYAYRARSAGRKATVGLALGWLNAVGTVVSGIILVVLFFFVLAAAGGASSFGSFL